MNDYGRFQHLTYCGAFTFGDAPAELIEERLPHKYAMELNRADMLNLLDVLLVACGQIDVTREERLEELSDWAAGMRSSILTTLDIEEI